MRNIDKGTRLANYLIDLFSIYVIWFLLGLILQFYGSQYFLFYFIMFTYYLIFEATTGQTLGKMFTKTEVVLKNGSKPTFLKIFIRSFWRIIPFDAFSYLFGSELGMHDLLSSTKLSIKQK